mgnify:CR=1 FL=1
MNMHYKDDKFFKKLSVLQKIREDYTQYLVEQFPNAQLLARYQNPRHAKLNLGQSAAKIVETAYPVVKIDKTGREIDNRDQQCIDTITHFVEVMSDKEKQGKKLSWQEKELICATKVYGAINTTFTQAADVPTTTGRGTHINVISSKTTAGGKALVSLVIRKIGS